MANAPNPEAPIDRNRGRLLRFDRVERFAHWANALLFTILIVTALPLYFPFFVAHIGRRTLVESIHLWAGLALPIPLVLSLLGPWGARLRRDVRRINCWTAGEIRWLRRLGREPVELDKFNPGQKLNAAFTAGVIVIMLATGVISKWYRPFPLSWRTGATFVHQVVAFAIFFVVVGHVAFALTHREALRSMLTGKITMAWAREHAPRWWREEQRDAQRPAPPAASKVGP